MLDGAKIETEIHALRNELRLLKEDYNFNYGKAVEYVTKQKLSSIFTVKKRELTTRIDRLKNQFRNNMGHGYSNVPRFIY